MSLLSLFLNLFQVNFYLSYFNWIVYVSLFYLSIFLVGLTIIDVFYVSYAISKKKFSYLWPIRALRSVCSLFVTALFLPLTELFFSMMACEMDDNGVMVNTTATDIVCWQGLHILYSASAIIVSSVFLVISIIVAMTYFDIGWDDDNPTSKISSDVDVFQIYSKIICMFVFTFFADESYQWMLMVVLLITSGGFFYKLMFERPYLNHVIALTWSIVSGIYAWTNLMLFLTKLLGFSDFQGGVELCFMSYPLIALVIIFSPNPLEKRLMTQFKDLANGYDCFDHIRYFVYLSSHDTIESRISLEGYIKKYNEEEQDGSSLLRYNQSIVHKQQNVDDNDKNSIPDGKSEKRENAQAKKMKVDQERKLMEHAFHLFKKGLVKFPKCTFLRIQYALFLLEKMKNKNWALRQLMKSEKKNPSFAEQFLIYRFKRVIEEEMTESAGNDSANLDIVSALAYQNHRQHWETYMETASQLHTKFWSYLTEDVNDLGKLSEIGSEINSTLALVEEHWDRMQRYKQNSGKIVRLYANFLVQVLNDKEGSKELMKSVSEGKAVIEDAYDFDNNDENQELSKFSEGGCGVIVSAGDSNLGKINKVSMGICSTFGYTKSELIGKDISILLPKLYCEQHKTLVDEGIDKVDDKTLYKERHVYAKHKSGYILAVDKIIKAIPSIVNNWQYVVCVHSDKKKMDTSVATVLVDKSNYITDVSFRAFDMLQLPCDSGLTRNTLISEFIPTIEDTKYIKEHLLIDYVDVTYYYPDGFNPQDVIQGENPSEKKERASAIKIRARGTVHKQLYCMAKEITLGDQGLVGYALIFKEPNKTLFTLRERIKDTIPMDNKSNIEWIYDTEKFMFTRVVAERVNNSEPEIESTNSSKSKQKSKIMGSKYLETNKNSRANLSPTEENAEDSDDENKGGSIFARLAKQHNKPWNKPDYAKGITTMRISKLGEFHVISKKALVEKQKEIIREAETSANIAIKKENEKKTGQAQQMNMSLKSRRDLINAIQNGKTYHAISGLTAISLLLLLAIIILSSIEYGLFTSRYNKIIDNTKVFVSSLDLEAQIAQGVESTRTLVLLNSGILTDYENYTTADSFESAIKLNLLKIQSTVDKTQKEISDLAKGFPNVKKMLLLDRDLPIKFKIGSTYKTELYNLLESLTMLNSYIFKIANSALNILTESNDDAYFIFANGLNGIFIRLRRMLASLNKDMESYSDDALSVLLIILIISVSVIFIGALTLIPFLRGVQNAKEEILMLFFQIKRGYAKTFAKQCQQFYNSLQKKRNRQDAGSEGEGSEKEMEDEEDDDEDKETLTNDARNYSSQMASGAVTRRLKKGSSNTLGIIFCEVLANAILSSYFVVAYVIYGALLFDANKVINRSFISISQLSTAHLMDYLGIRETILNSTWPLENKTGYNYTLGLITNITKYQENIKNYFDLDKGYAPLYFGGFIELLDSYFDQSACLPGRNNYFTTREDCVKFAHTIAEKVF